jgi:two-component system CheB/CheR fusion protein
MAASNMYPRFHAHAHPFAHARNQAGNDWGEMADLTEETKATTAPTPVCAIGASAGGVTALSQLFSRLDPDLGMAYVVIVHLSPDGPSQLTAILSKCTRLSVIEVTRETQINPNCVYVIPPNNQLVIRDNRIALEAFSEPRGPRAPIDLFFRSLAAGRGDGMAVVLTGAGSDGAVGVQAVKEAGGVIFAQDPNEAEYPMMPRSSIATGVVDFVETLEALPRRIAEVAHSKRALRSLEVETAEVELRQLLSFLRARTGHDFSNYKRATVLRRVGRRMQVARLDSLAAYSQYLRENPEEASNLFRDLLISVTMFFRDGAAHDALAGQVIRPCIAQCADDEDLRVWVAGCATGEEAYSIAILFLEQAAELGIKLRLQIFATDLDEGALATAREGRYPASIVADVTEERLRRFFAHEGAHYRIRKEVRDLVLFATHSVLKDPPFMRLNLISCRNLMIYLEREVQRQVCSTFHYALRPASYLFLGSAETADNVSDLFQVVDREARIYCAKPSAARLLPLLSHPHVPLAIQPVISRLSTQSEFDRSIATAHSLALESASPPSILVDEDQRVLHLSETAGRFLQPSRGVINNEITTLLRPELRLDLRSAMHRAFDRNESTLSLPISTHFDGEQRRVLLQVTPVPTETHASRRALVFFLDGGEISTGDREQSADRPPEGEDIVRRLHEELRQAHDRLNASRKEHAFATQELRAANEELQSINEEYRSTSEELETSKEELQSMNEELQTVNSELKNKLATLSQAHGDLQNLIAATEIGTLFVDPELRIRLYTPMVARIFNIADSDVGRAITDFTHNLVYDGLTADAAAVRRDLAPIEKELGTTDGRRLFMRLRPYRTMDDRIDGVVVTFVDITSRYTAERQLGESEERFRRLVEGAALAVWETDGSGRMAKNSVSWQAFTGQAPADSLRDGWLDAIHPDDRETMWRRWTADIARDQIVDVDFRLRDSMGGWRWVKAKAAPLGQSVEGARRWIGMCIDIDDIKTLQDRQAVLVGELQHRTRNLIGVVGGMAEGTLSTSESLGDFRVVFGRRLEALSRVQGLLSRANQEPVRLDALLRLEFAALASDDQQKRLFMEGPDVTLPKRVVQTFALALHELATNATKYGALTNDEGRVDVNWREIRDSDGRRLQLEWIESGLDLAREMKGPLIKGFGRQLIEDALPYSHGATTSFELRESGVRCTIVLPLLDGGDKGVVG